MSGINRKERLKCVRRLVVKVGTRVLSSENNLPDVRWIETLAGQIAQLRCRGIEVVVVSSGAIGAGMGQLSMSRRPRSIPQLQAAAAVGQNQLMHSYQVAFGRHNLTIAQILLTADDLKNRQRYLNVRNTLLTLWHYGVIPVLNENDSVATDEITVGDNDNLSAQVANLIDAHLLIILSDTDGFFSADPRKAPQARLISTITEITPELEKLAGQTATEVATGGMRTKLEAAKILTASGQMMLIANGRKHSLVSILNGKEVGTLFLPQAERMASRKRWIAFSHPPKGVLVVDDGAVQAIAEKGKSLLPSGVIKLKGEFENGEVVNIQNLKGQDIARGLVNYRDKELKKILGKKSSEIEKILGYCYYEEVVHRDNLVVL
ncbi:MAG: glutamate 5-kinase [Candidatus Latescibacteria bacterium]|nr:glutamate 5-kinase [Candidatus Latescibacterota bacterium]